MTLKREEFEALVAQCQDLAEQHPDKYKVRVALLAGLGYLYIAFVLALIIGSLWALSHWLCFGHGRYLAWKLALPLVVLLYFVVRALIVPLYPPQGKEIEQSQAPELFKDIESIRLNVAAPKIDKVLVTPEMNAAIVQISHIPCLGYGKNYLILGLPLMQALSPAHFQSVLAHEMGHLSGNHGGFSSWIYRLRMTWEQLVFNTAQSSWLGQLMFNSFFSWYAPFFSAYTYVLARQNEYQADQCSVELVGAKSAAEALIEVEIECSYIDRKFWKEIYQLADSQAIPPSNVFSLMQEELKAPSFQTEDVKRWLQEALLAKTNSYDTHPALPDRLKALNYKLPVSSPEDNEAEQIVSEFRSLLKGIEKSAAQYYFPSQANDFISYFNQTWFDAHKEVWSERFEHCQKALRLIEELEQKRKNITLSEEDLWQLADNTLDLKGESFALPYYEELHRCNPDNAKANFALGSVKLALYNDEGIKHIEKSMQGSENYVLAGCNEIYAYYTRQGKHELARSFLLKGDQQYELELKANEERTLIRSSDMFVSPDVKEVEIEKIRAGLSKHNFVQEAYLVRKLVNVMSAMPCYVLLIVPRKGQWWKFQDEGKEIEALQQFLYKLTSIERTELDLSMLYAGSELDQAIVKAVKAVDSSLIYTVQEIKEPVS